MTRSVLAAGLAAGLALAVQTAAHAQVPAPLPRIAYAKPVTATTSAPAPAAVAMPMQQGGYVKLDAPMNPVPVPHVPHQVGGTMTTNQAFYPHEMLYAHEYNAMYAPYYYRVKGHWVLTPWGVRERQKWRLEGTRVKVKYRSDYSPLSLFIPPSTRTTGFGGYGRKW